jgi:hypothetical protein
MPASVAVATLGLCHTTDCCQQTDPYHVTGMFMTVHLTKFFLQPEFGGDLKIVGLN